MTGKASPDEPKGEPDLARFLRDWTTLWREELQAQADDPEGMKLAMLAGMENGGMSSEMSAAMEMWRAAMLAWADTVGVPPSSMAGSRDRATAPRTEAAAVAPDARDAAVEHLARRVDELEARLAKLETARRRRG
jgi:hypothetical protein